MGRKTSDTGGSTGAVITGVNATTTPERAAKWDPPEGVRSACSTSCVPCEWWSGEMSRDVESPAAASPPW